MPSLPHITWAGSGVPSTPEPCPPESVLLALFSPRPQRESGEQKGSLALPVPQGVAPLYREREGLLHWWGWS